VNFIKWSRDWIRAIIGGYGIWRKNKNNPQYKEVEPMHPLQDYKDEDLQEENPFLILGFWRFAIIATLFVSFFPISLLLSLFFGGVVDTMLLVGALLHDLVKTLMAVLAIVVPLAILIMYLFI